MKSNTRWRALNFFSWFLDLNECKHIKQYQAYNDKLISACKIYKQEWDKRENINRKHERFVLKFEQLALRPRFHRNEEFLLNTISKNHSVLQHLLVPLLVPAKTSTHKPASSIEVATSKHSIQRFSTSDQDSWSQTKSLTDKNSYRIDLKMNDSILCEKTRDLRFYGSKTILEDLDIRTLEKLKTLS